MVEMYIIYFKGKLGCKSWRFFIQTVGLVKCRCIVYPDSCVCWKGIGDFGDIGWEVPIWYTDVAMGNNR